MEEVTGVMLTIARASNASMLPTTLVASSTLIPLSQAPSLAQEVPCGLSHSLWSPGLVTQPEWGGGEVGGLMVPRC